MLQYGLIGGLEYVDGDEVGKDEVLGICGGVGVFNTLTTLEC